MSKYRFNSADHIHELDCEDGQGYKPLKGTTTVIKEVYPPPLAWYGSAKAVELLGYVTDKKEPDENKRTALLENGYGAIKKLIGSGTATDYKEFLEKCYKNHNTYMKERGKIGKNAHALIEMYIRECLDNGGTVISHDAHSYDPLVVSFVKWAYENVKKFLVCEAHCYSERLWVGGITDWLAIMKNGKLYVGDNKPAVYHSHFIQVAGYAVQIEKNGLFTENGTPIIKLELTGKKN